MVVFCFSVFSPSVYFCKRAEAGAGWLAWLQAQVYKHTDLLSIQRAERDE